MGQKTAKIRPFIMFLSHPKHWKNCERWKVAKTEVNNYLNSWTWSMIFHRTYWHLREFFCFDYISMIKSVNYLFVWKFQIFPLGSLSRAVMGEKKWGTEVVNRKFYNNTNRRLHFIVLHWKTFSTVRGCGGELETVMETKD